ncbi:uncharacterized protein LOC113771427 [Coffea eugenioides]|uniref:uncharacterized protein LOC113771427 n=1 Tax=Coffea eugenioides TaxID=49369 RepID=UPI000F608F75|nr:uncharacterized protein LOC113771427 [Coffea eugenioides]
MTRRPRCCNIVIEIADGTSLFCVLEVLHFPFISWARCCVTTAKFSFNLKGFLVGDFSSSKGLRPGDPISPYLFLIVKEVFSQLFDDYITADAYDFYPRCAELGISHISFADDLFVMASAAPKSFE